MHSMLITDLATDKRKPKMDGSVCSNGFYAMVSLDFLM